MPVSIGMPASKSGDIKVLKQGSGSLSAGSAGWVAADSFVLPSIPPTTQLKIYVEIDTTSGSENAGLNISPNSASATGLFGINNPTPRQGGYCICQTSLLTPATMNYTLFNYQAATYAVSINSSELGDLSTSHTIYLNLLRQAATAFNYKWAIIQEGQGIK
jgi:hypothetical protein